MAFPVVEFSRQGYKIRKVFGKKSTLFKWNYQILRIGVMASCQTLGIILVINGFRNWFYQKMSITTNVLLNSYSSMKKKFRKIRSIFDIEKWLWKSELCYIWHSIPNQAKYLEHFMVVFIDLWPCIYTTKLS